MDGERRRTITSKEETLETEKIRLMNFSGVWFKQITDDFKYIKWIFLEKINFVNPLQTVLLTTHN